MGNTYEEAGTSVRIFHVNRLIRSAEASAVATVTLKIPKGSDRRKFSIALMRIGG